jgi:hypothetical protein
MHVVPHATTSSPQLGHSNESVAVLVEHAESFAQFVFFVVFVGSFSHHLQEFFEVDQPFAYGQETRRSSDIDIRSAQPTVAIEFID